MANYYYDKYTATSYYIENPVFETYYSDVSQNYVTPNYSFDRVHNNWVVTTAGGYVLWATAHSTGLKYISCSSPATINDTRYVKATATQNQWEVYLLKYYYNPIGYEKSSLVTSDIIAADGTYPNNGRHTDGYWYVRKGLAFPSFEMCVDNVLRGSADGWVSVNGVIRHIDNISINIGGVAKQI